MIDRSIYAAAGAALVLALPAHGQTRCVDAQGKVFYQQGPCPGAVQRPAPKVAKAEKKVESPAEKAARERCDRIENDIKEMRTVVPQLQAKQRAEVEKRVARAEQERAKACQK